MTGASGGLGNALARQYARPGVDISLWGRDEARLAEVARICADAGASVRWRSLDLSDTESAVETLLADDAAAPFDLAVFASGQGDIRAPGAKVEDPAFVARLGQVNFVAPAAMAAAIAGRMAERGHGSIALIGSAAAFHALPFAAAYAGTKAGLARFAEALRIGMKAHDVSVTLISPGFIATAAARRVPGPKPFELSPEAVAARIACAVEQRKAHLVLPWPFALLRVVDQFLPRVLRERVLLLLTPPGW